MAVKNMVKLGAKVTFGRSGDKKQSGKVIKLNPKTARIKVSRCGEFLVTYNLIQVVSSPKKKSAPRKKAAGKKICAVPVNRPRRSSTTKARAAVVQRKRPSVRALMKNPSSETLSKEKARLHREIKQAKQALLTTPRASFKDYDLYVSKRHARLREIARREGRATRSSRPPGVPLRKR